jgi:hypothetical protein
MTAKPIPNHVAMSRQQLVDCVIMDLRANGSVDSCTLLSRMIDRNRSAHHVGTVPDVPQGLPKEGNWRLPIHTQFASGAFSTLIEAMIPIGPIEVPVHSTPYILSTNLEAAPRIASATVSATARLAVVVSHIPIIFRVTTPFAALSKCRNCEQCNDCYSSHRYTKSVIHL